MASVKSQAERTVALSAGCKSLEGTITKRKSLLTQLRNELSTLHTQEANMQAAVAGHTDAGAFAAGRMQELERSLVSVEKDLGAGDAEWCALMAEESQLLDIRKVFEGQVEVLGGELWGHQAQLADLTSQGDGTRWCVNTLATERDVAAAHDVTAIGNLQAAEVGRAAFSCYVTTAML